MKVSRRTDYALRAMLELALRSPSKGLIRTSEIARHSGAPLKFLEAILSDLRRLGLVESQRGSEGGFRLARSPDLITIGDVWFAMDGPPSLSGRSLHRRAASEGANRAIRELWRQIESATRQAAQQVTLAKLAQRAQEEANVSDFSI